MGTTLRLGFAMGGGVSLGTFNGSALAEVLKLTILRGRDRLDRPFDKVEVDVFSGASAGSMALGVMLRALVQRDPDREAAAHESLVAQFPDEYMGKPEAIRSALIAAQVVQDLQDEIWIREISLKKLLPTKDEGSVRLRHTAGLVDRGAVEEIAAKYLRFKGKISLKNRQILADRVLFASSLANLTPILAKAFDEYPGDEIGFLALADAMASRVHRELRVFDLHFNKIDESLENNPEFPGRWCRYHAGQTLRSKHGIGSLLEPRVWAKIAATSIASGAFPGAFEPVVLERRNYEYGPKLWPDELKGKDRHCFTYVDGGTFNNEPIREAFRLASFIDAQSPGEEFERCIVFVDPNVAAPAISLRVPVHKRYDLHDPNWAGTFDGHDLVKMRSLDRLIPQLGTLLGAIVNESTVIEADKIYQTRREFELRNMIRMQLVSSLSDSPDVGPLQGLIDFCSERLKSDRVNLMIPAGALTTKGELARVIAEESRPDPEGNAPLKALGNKTSDDIQALLDDPGSVPESERKLWLQALTFVAVDRIMDLEGKLENSRLIAIAPIIDPGDPEKRRVRSLPGGKISGFGGFTYERCGEYESAMGRYCARQFLEACKLVEASSDVPELPQFTEEDEEVYQDKLKAGMAALRKRVIHMVKDAKIPVISDLPKFLLNMFLESKFDKLAEPESRSRRYEFRIEVPDKDFEFDGKGLADRDLRPVRIDGKLYLITFADFTDSEITKKWSGTHVLKNRQAISIDKDRTLLPDKTFCSIRMPTKSMLKKADLLGYPIFVAELNGETDEGQALPSSKWKPVENGAVGLEETIFQN